MPAKKTIRAKKSPAPTPTTTTTNGKRPIIRLTSAIGPKATTIVVICVMAGGILVAARQQQSKPPAGADSVMSSEMADASQTAAKKTAVHATQSGSSAPAAAPEYAATAVTVTTAAPKAPSVTLTGCLERSADTYRLKDASGADAPKARSWKSGFLKKGPATIDVVDGAHGLRLADQVGHRVSVTGTLVDREMQARSMRQVASSCGEPRP